MVRQRVRIRFAKQSDLRMVGHRDLVRTMERCFRRAGIRLGMSQGFHPKPRMTFPAALAVGIEGIDEVMEMELAEALPADALLERLAGVGVPGLRFLHAEILPPGAKKARPGWFTYRMPVPPPYREAAARAVDRVAVGQSGPPEGPPGPDRLEAIRLAGETLIMRFRVTGGGGGPGPRGMLAELGLGELERQGCCLVRSAVELEP